MYSEEATKSTNFLALLKKMGRFFSTFFVLLRFYEFYFKVLEDREQSVYQSYLAYRIQQPLPNFHLNYAHSLTSLVLFFCYFFLSKTM